MTSKTHVRGAPDSSSATGVSRCDIRANCTGVGNRTGSPAAETMLYVLRNALVVETRVRHAGSNMPRHLAVPGSSSRFGEIRLWRVCPITFHGTSKQSTPASIPDPFVAIAASAGFLARSLVVLFYNFQGKLRTSQSLLAHRVRTQAIEDCARSPVTDVYFPTQFRD